MFTIWQIRQLEKWGIEVYVSISLFEEIGEEGKCGTICREPGWRDTWKVTKAQRAILEGFKLALDL